MAGKFAPRRHCAKIGLDNNVVTVDAIRSRTDCLIQLLGAFHDIADFDDIHQAAERLNVVQAWIRREARNAATDPIFEDETGGQFRVSQVGA